MRSETSGLPTGLRAVFGLALAYLAAAAATMPWRLGSLWIARFTVPLALAAFVCGVALCVPRWRRRFVAVLRDGRIRISPSVVAALALAFALLLGRILLLRFVSLELNASDTTIYYDRPLEETLHGRLMYIASQEKSLFAMHGSYLILIFVPLYATAPSPLWLLGAHVLALAAAFAAGFALFRLVLNDDLAALLLAAAFPLHSNTASALQYGFHIEVFYPLGVFLLASALLRRRALGFAVAALLIALVKEDSILLLGGIALSLMLGRQRRPRWALAAGALGAASFLVTAYVVLPHFSGSAPGSLWYLSTWSDFGRTPAGAAAGIVARPGELVSKVARSGVADILEPLLLTPLAGGRSLVACLPAFAVYGTAGWEGISKFGTHYGLPVLPLVFVAAASGIRRLSRFRLRAPFRPALRFRRRLAAALVLVACAVDGAGYVFLRPHPARSEIATTLATLGDRPVRIQGSLYPHAGYPASRKYLDRQPQAGEAVLVAPGTNPFPLSAAEFSALVERLSADPLYRRSQTPGGLLLFVPRR